jgi:hypothetical protein
VYSRVTLLEVDTVRIDVDSAVDLFREEVLPALREQEGYEGAFVLTTPEGKAMILTLWVSEEQAADGPLYAGTLERYTTLFRAPPGRERYDVSFLELSGVAVG